MKKTISTSIGGIVFNVEEDAHEKLSNYLNAISASLKDSDGHNEIMSDIEGRIAEILQQKLSAYKQVITIAEIDEVIGIMGQPEDYSSGAATSGSNQQNYTSPGYDYSTRRRIFRDPDDKVVFGVCSGISQHFGIDPIWMRLAFGIAFFTAGFGFILYLLLAIIIPKARTAAEKLEMRGEPIDVNNLKKVFEEEMSHVGKRVRDLGEDIKSGATNSRAKQFGRDLEDFFFSVGNGAGKVLGGIMKAILAFVGFIVAVICISLLVALIVSLCSGVNVIHIESNGGNWGHYSVNSFFNLLSVTGGMRGILLSGIFLFIGIPVLALAVRFGRAAMGIKRGIPFFNIAAGILWSVGLIFIVIGVASIASHFSVTSSSRNQLKIETTGQILYVKMTPVREYNNIVSLDSLNLYISDENVFQGNPSLCIEQSPDTSYHLIENRMARGISHDEALNFAEDIDYNFNTRDSTLFLDPIFTLEQGTGWRRQRLDLTLEVPINKSVYLPDGIDNVLCKAIRRKGQHIGGSAWRMSNAGLVDAN